MPPVRESRTTGLYARPVEPVQTLAARYYTDSAVFAIERNTIFAPAWNLVAYEHQLRRTGDYVAENLAGWPIFVRRNETARSRVPQHVPSPRRPDRVGR